jgi:tight adherence protein B
MLSWAALAAALVLVPGVPAAHARALALAGRGRLRARASPAAVGTSALSVWVAPGTCLAVAAGVDFVGGPVLAIAALVAALTALGLVRAAARRRRDDRATAELLAAVTLMAAELEAGTSPGAAVLAGAEACPSHEAALRVMAARAATGGDPRGDSATTSGTDPPQLASLAHAWQVANTTGAPLAEVWSRVARDLAERIEQRRAVAIALAGARSSAALLAMLPIVGVLLGTAMQAQPLRVLFLTATGHAVLLIGVCLDAAGLGWTHLLTARAETA